MDQDCYFYTEEELPPDQQLIRVLCMGCHEKNPDLGWFWQGSKLGYGPFLFACNKCGHVVYQPKGENEEPAPCN